LIKPHPTPNEIDPGKQQSRPEQTGWGYRVAWEAERTEVIDEQRANQLPGNDGRKEERGP
jgi:hypothetical protein